MRAEERRTKSVYNLAHHLSGDRFDRRRLRGVCDRERPAQEVIPKRMPRTRIARLNEERVMHAMGIDDAYRVERVLAEGRTGTTERVTIDGSGPFVRKKIPSSFANRGAWAALAECACPRLPRVAATYEMPDRFAVVYDYVPGDTLEHAMAARGRFSPVEAVQVVCDLCEATADLHAHGIVHCDISPANVILAADGAHLIDLGIARSIGQNPTDNIGSFGTWGFAAPEQYGFANVDGRTDVHALACVLGYLLTGAKPDNDAYNRLLSDAATVPPALADVVRRGSAFEPSMRCQTPAELADAAEHALDAAATTSVPSASSVTTPQGAPADAPNARSRSSASQTRRHKIARGVVIGVAAIAIVAAGIAMIALGVKPLLDRLSLRHIGTEVENTSEIRSESSSSNPFDQNPADVTGGATSTSRLLEVAESGWCVESSGYICYGVGIYNNTSEFAITYPGVTITGRDENGSILFSQDQIVSVAQPGQTLYFGGIAGNGTAPDFVEFAPIEPHDWALSQPTGTEPTFQTSNVSAVPDGFGGVNFTGEASLESGEYESAGMGQIAVTVILRDESGYIVYGAIGFANRPTAERSVSFEVAGGKVPAYSSIDVYVQVW